MKDIIVNSQARKKIFDGTQKLADIVGMTLGPHGRNVILERPHNTPLITNDGVIIAREVEFQDKFENLGSSVLLQASIQTNNQAGDGTTSAIVLGAEIMKQGWRQIEMGVSPVILKESLLSATTIAQKAIDEIAKPIQTIDDICAIATNSCGNSLYGQLVSKAFEIVGTDGVVMLEENREGKTIMRHTQGFEIKGGLLSPYMIEDHAKAETTYRDTYMLVVNGTINSAKDLLPILEVVSKEKINLVIIANDFSQESINMLLLNRVKAGLNVIGIKLTEIPGRATATLEDLAALTGATVISHESDLKISDATKVHLGFADFVSSNMATSKIITNQNPNTNSTNFDNRIELIKSQIKNAPDEYTKTRLIERLGKLTKGIAVISVGAATEIELKEKKLRLEDAIHAVKSATEDGIVPGGGLSYLYVKKALESLRHYSVTEKNQSIIGFEILEKSLESIIRKICQNADENPDIIIQEINKKNEIANTSNYNIGYDARNKNFCNLIEHNIIDPAKVVKSVIKNATSAISTLLTTDAIICKLDK